MDNSKMIFIGIYLGVKGFGTAKIDSKESVLHIFFVDGYQKEFLISSSNNFSIQNTLQVGYIFQFESQGQEITSATLLDRGIAQIELGTIDSLTSASLTIDKKPILLDQNTKTYKIDALTGQCRVTEDTLHLGDTVKIVMKDNKAQTIYKSFISKVYKPPIQGTPGLKTLKNFLATAMTPVGTTLYVFGGGWNWQDTFPSNQQMTIGISPSWIDFFQMHDATYKYKDIDNPPESYYMYADIIQYYFCGLDCSAFVGWTVYNTIEKVSNTVENSKGYGFHSTSAAKMLSEHGWGTWTRDLTNGFMPGDIFSIDGHVWISLGTCEDGSVVIVHSSPSKSRLQQPGAGVQISAINPKDTGNDCEAYKLASTYMSRYYPEWSKRYEAFLNDYSRYAKISENENAGKFTWDLTGGKMLSDEEGFFRMKPAEILARLFGEI